MVLLYLNTLVPLALIGCRMPLVLKLTVAVAVFVSTPPSLSVTATDAVYVPTRA